MSAARIGVAPRATAQARSKPTASWTWRLQLADVPDLVPPGLLLVASGSVLTVGIAALGTTSLDGVGLPLVVLVGVALLLQASAVYGASRSVDPVLIGLVGLCLVGAAVLGGVPSYFAGLGLKAIIHHSVLMTPVLLGLGVPCACVSLHYLFRGTPRAEDVSRYPLVLLPVVLILATYALVGFNLIGTGLQQLTHADRTDGSPGWTVFLHEFVNPNVPPYVMRAGLLNQVLGTGLLVVMTMLIALPIGVGTGVFISEVADARLAQLVRMSTTALRGMSVFVLALLATSLVAFAQDTPLGPLVAGYFVDSNGIVRLLRGSYLTAAIVTALLIIPVLARATEEGCRSLPRGIREGSAALGATSDYTLLHLTLPWCVPNIVTGLLLGSAEAAGGVATLLFIAGTGENGVGPFAEVTTLAFAVFYSEYSPNKPFRDLHHPYQYAAGVALLAISLGLTAAALIVKRRQALRYGGT